MTVYGEFRCPECGGSNFGTSWGDTDDPSTATVTCHDKRYVCCDWKGPYDTPGIFVRSIEWDESTETLADAIRNAGIRCRNCKNWHDPGGEKYNYLPDGWGHCSGITADSEYDGEMISATGSEGIGTIVNTKGDFFCANHSELI